jgi:hypothetical protein
MSGLSAATLRWGRFARQPGMNGAMQARDSRADDRARRNEMAERLLARRNLRGRVLQRHDPVMPAGASRVFSGELK